MTIESGIILIVVGLAIIRLAVFYRRGLPIRYFFRGSRPGRSSIRSNDSVIVANWVSAPYLGVSGGIMAASGVMAAWAPVDAAEFAVFSGLAVAVVLQFIGAFRGARAARAARQPPTG